MKYKVHRLEIKRDNFHLQLEQYLNSLEGEVISVVPNVTQYFLCYGAKIDYVLIVEKVK
jgi:hypothetical protein